MKATGRIRRFDDLGRIVIPRELREQLFGKAKSGYGVGEGEPMEIFLDGEDIILRKHKQEY